MHLWMNAVKWTDAELSTAIHSYPQVIHRVAHNYVHRRPESPIPVRKL